MSSDSGESHTSPPNGDDIPGPDTTSDILPTQDAIVTSDVPENDTSGEENDEVDLLDAGRNGITFARQRKTEDARGEATKQDSSSGRRPTSPESMSTPDDTPSIQVGASGGYGKPISLTLHRAPASPRLEAVFRHRIAHCELTGRRLCSPLKDASLLDSPRHRLARPDHQPHNFSPIGRDSRPYPAIAYSMDSRMTKTHLRPPGTL